MGAVILTSAVALALAGMPIAFVLGLTAVFAFGWLGDPGLFLILPQRMFAGMDSFVLLAIPFFVLAGEIMNRAGITQTLVAFSNAMVGHLRGGLAHVTILTNIFFAGITGSAISEAVATGSILIPAMEREGYDRRFAAAVVSASSIIGPIIPPSIPMVIYASIVEVSVAGLFAAGFLPGLILGGAYMGIAWYASLRHGYSEPKARASLRELWRAFREALLSLLMPVIILGGILGGVFTPTEAAAVAVMYGLVVGFLIFRTLRPSDLPELFRRAAITTSIILFIVGAATAFGWVLSYERIPQRLAAAIVAVAANPYIFFLVVNLVLLVAGMFLDLTISMVLLAPLFAPVAVSLGIHPLHFAIVFCVNLTVGLVTPPYGLVLFTTSSLTRLPLEEIVRPLWPFIVVSVGTVFLISYVPIIAMAIPRLLGFY